jgi:hypothetical protein
MPMFDPHTPIFWQRICLLDGVATTITPTANNPIPGQKDFV